MEVVEVVELARLNAESQLILMLWVLEDLGVLFREIRFAEY